MAEFFSESGHHEKAAQLLVKTRHIEEALYLCEAHNILITEKMAEDMTLPKTDSGIQLSWSHVVIIIGADVMHCIENETETDRRMKLLIRLADCCVGQGSYHLATKKYTQGGDKTTVCT